MITNPPIIRTQILLMTAAPIQPAVVPNARKITDSPALNASELSITARRAPAFEPSFKLSMLTPDINEMYPGTSGRTHGERNDRIPAAKAIQIVMFELCLSNTD